VSRRSRLDVELVRRGLVASRTLAREAIAAGLVTVDGAPGRKPATAVAPQQQIVVMAPPRRWVSRGGDKLDGALAELGLGRVDGRVCLDAGASTGGFTDVLLARGASCVIAVDVGYGQLAWRLRSDPRVHVVERTHVRDLTDADLGGHHPDLVVADLSFISLTAVLQPLRDLVGPGADWCLLVKPQFEVGRTRVGRGGVVRDPDAWRAALDGVRDAADAVGLAVVAGTVSPLPGPSGNVEFFVRLGDARADEGTSAHDAGDGAGWPSLRAALLADAVTLRDGTNR
jgi:23S rRNA (cytidine1920-2'-O)/16S rRNA (cytidine1409-2'-O)-methyltransferase